MLRRVHHLPALFQEAQAGTHRQRRRLRETVPQSGSTERLDRRVNTEGCEGVVCLNPARSAPLRLLLLLFGIRGKTDNGIVVYCARGYHREITDTAQVVTVGFLQQNSSLILGQPVSCAGSKLLCAFDPADAWQRASIRTEQAGVGRLYLAPVGRAQLSAFSGTIGTNSLSELRPWHR